MAVPDKDIYDWLKTIAKNEGLGDDPTINITTGSEKGGGFSGVHSAVEITNGSKTLTLFIKISEEFRKEILIEDIFDREIYFYTTLYPAYLKFQTDRNVSNPFQCVPKYYGSLSNRNRKGIVLENLRENGFTLFNKKIQMTDEHILVILKEYARFHAVSFAMKDQDRKLYDKLTAGLTDLFSNFCVISGVGKAYSHYINEVKKMYESEQKIRISRKLGNIAENVESVFKQYVDEYSVITHGDCWCNNMMFNYENPSDQSCPLDVKILDWQMSRLTSPVFDLSYFFYGVASKEAMDNLEYFLQVYYDTLSENIREMGSDPHKVFPYSALKEHWTKLSKFGLVMSFAVVRIMSAEDKEVENLAERLESGNNIGELAIYDIKNQNLYHERIKNIVEHFVNNNFI